MDCRVMSGELHSISGADKEAKVAAAKAKRDQQVIEARAEGRDQGRKEWMPYVAGALEVSLGAVGVAHKAEIERTRAETIEHERKAHAHGFWKGGQIVGIICLALGALGAIAIMDLVQRSSFNAAASFGERQVMTGALLGQGVPRETAPQQRPPSGQDGWARGREPARAP
jgi:hypothetical protein